MTHTYSSLMDSAQQANLIAEPLSIYDAICIPTENVIWFGGHLRRTYQIYFPDVRVFHRGEYEFVGIANVPMTGEFAPQTGDLSPFDYLLPVVEQINEPF